MCFISYAANAINALHNKQNNLQADLLTEFRLKWFEIE